MRFIQFIVTTICLYIASVNSITNCLEKQECSGQSISDDVVNCQNSNVCKSSIITATDSITCSADYSCQQVVSLTAKNDITCSGRVSCGGGRVTPQIESTDGSVLCTGGNSCEKASITAQNIKCLPKNGNTRSCQKSTLYAANDIELGTGYASYLSSITASGDVYITDRLGGYYAKTIKATNIYVTADRGSVDAKKIIVANSFICSGEDSCSYIKKISSSTNVLNVEFSGYQAGKKTKIKCPTSGNCTITCLNGGCISNTGYLLDTCVYATKQTLLTIIPSECSPDNSNRPDTCPMVKIKKKSEIMQIMDDIDKEIEKEIISEETKEEEHQVVDDDFMEYVGIGLEEDERLLNDFEVSGLGWYMVIGVMIICLIGLFRWLVVSHCDVQDKYQTDEFD